MVKSACQMPHKQEIEKTKSNFRKRREKIIKRGEGAVFCKKASHKETKNLLKRKSSHQLNSNFGSKVGLSPTLLDLRITDIYS